MLDIVELSRLQFALTAMYHFLFVPLTLGMAFLLAIMETVYVLSGKQIYKDMTKFWGKLFGINFALGVATGLTMEFQFGTKLVVLLPLCWGHLRCAAGHRRFDGLLPRIHLCRSVLLRLGSSE